MLLTCPRLLDSVNAAAYAVCTENTINVCHATCVGRCSKKKANVKGKTNSTSVGDGSHDKAAVLATNCAFHKEFTCQEVCVAPRFCKEPKSNKKIQFGKLYKRYHGVTHTPNNKACC